MLEDFIDTLQISVTVSEHPDIELQLYKEARVVLKWIQPEKRLAYVYLFENNQIINQQNEFLTPRHGICNYGVPV